MSKRAFFVAGKFGAAQGIKGCIRVISLTENPDDIFHLGPWYLSAKSICSVMPTANTLPQSQGVDADQSSSQVKEYTFVAIEPAKWVNHPKGFVVTLPGLTDRNLAQLLTNQLIYLPLDALQPLDDDEFYWRDLIGLAVLDHEGVPRGQISEILETGANDVLVIESDVGKGQSKRTLVPYIPEQVVGHIDLDAQTMVLHWDFDDDGE